MNGFFGLIDTYCSLLVSNEEYKLVQPEIICEKQNQRSLQVLGARNIMVEYSGKPFIEHDYIANETYGLTIVAGDNG
jgi:hypothetical protein